jgi:hypothetical protein
MIVAEEVVVWLRRGNISEFPNEYVAQAESSPKE